MPATASGKGKTATPSAEVGKLEEALHAGQTSGRPIATIPLVDLEASRDAQQEELSRELIREVVESLENVTAWQPIIVNTAGLIDSVRLEASRRKITDGALDQIDLILEVPLFDDPPVSFSVETLDLKQDEQFWLQATQVAESESDPSRPAALELTVREAQSIRADIWHKGSHFRILPTRRTPLHAIVEIGEPASLTDEQGVPAPVGITMALDPGFDRVTAEQDARELIAGIRQKKGRLKDYQFAGTRSDQFLQALPGDRVSITMNDGRTLVFEATERREYSSGLVVWKGNLVASNGRRGSAYLRIDRAGSLVGTMNDGREQWSIYPTSDPSISIVYQSD